MKNDFENRKQRVKTHALSNLLNLLPQIFPAGKTSGHHFQIGNVQGDAGESLKIEIYGEKAGLWHDFATDEGGDIFDLLAYYWSLDPKNQFPQLLDKAEEYFGLKPSHSSKPVTTGTWVYKDEDGQPWIQVQRVEVNGEKSYYPLDLKQNIKNYLILDPCIIYPTLLRQTVSFLSREKNVPKL